MSKADLWLSQMEHYDTTPAQKKPKPFKMNRERGLKLVRLTKVLMASGGLTLARIAGALKTSEFQASRYVSGELRLSERVANVLRELIKNKMVIPRK